MKFKKRLLGMALAVIMGISATGCGNNEKAANSDETVINLWHQWTNEDDAMRIATEQTVENYMKENPDVKIDIHMLENEAYKTKISTEFAGSAKGIDLFFYWGGGRGGKLVNADKLLAVEDYISDEVKGSIKEGAESFFVYNDKMYALPMYSWVLTLYCNEELIEEAGGVVPTTYEELLDTCKKLRDHGVEIPIAQGIKEGWQAAFVFEALAAKEVGVDNILKMFNGEVGIDDPGYLRAAEKTKELYDAGAFGDNPTELSNGDADTLYLTGKSAMRLQGNWFTESLYTNKDSVVADKTVAINIPMVAGGNGLESDYCGGFIDSFFINKNVSNPEKTVDFYTYYLKELAKVRQESGQGFSGWTDPVSDENLPEVAKELVTLSETLKDGAVAWDTALDESKASVHLDSVQSLFTASGDPVAVIEEHKAAFSE